MPSKPFIQVGRLKSVDQFREYVKRLDISLPCDDEIQAGPESPLAQPYRFDKFQIGNRFAIQPMEGWDGAANGNPTEYVTRRWRRFGMSGAKLIWGGEAVAVCRSGRANPNQLVAGGHTRAGIGRLLEALLETHRERIGSPDDLLVGLQLTHSGRFCQPTTQGKPEPRILYHHPILDRRFNVDPEMPILTDDEIRRIIEHYLEAARMAYELGFQFVDIKHCHGYLGHEFLSAFTRPGFFGGDFENRTRFLREIVQGIQASVPNLSIGVRLSAFDFVPFHADASADNGRGVPEDFSECLPYRYGFGMNSSDPIRFDLAETFRFLDLLAKLDIRMVNITAGSPYYTPHIQRPAFYPPSDGYQPPEDPLVGVARQIKATAQIKARYPDFLVVGSAYSYLQEYLPHVSQSAVRDGKVDFVGLGRMVLAYPELPHDVLTRGKLTRRKICRTFSDCTTGPRNHLVSGCFPLDAFYKKSPEGERLREIKKQRRIGRNASLN